MGIGGARNLICSFGHVQEDIEQSLSFEATIRITVLFDGGQVMHSGRVIVHFTNELQVATVDFSSELAQCFALMQTQEGSRPVPPPMIGPLGCMPAVLRCMEVH